MFYFVFNVSELNNGRLFYRTTNDVPCCSTAGMSRELSGASSVSVSSESSGELAGKVSQDSYVLKNFAVSKSHKFTYARWLRL